MRRCVVVAVTALLALAPPAVGRGDPSPEQPSFDGYAAGAVTLDRAGLAGLLWAVAGDCGKLGDDLQRRQCRGVREARARRARRFLYRPGPAAVSIQEGGADAGVTVVLRGCLECETPLDIGAGDGEPRFVVTYGSLAVSRDRVIAPELGRFRARVPASTVDAWRKDPGRLRVELLFSPGRAIAWTQDGVRGVFVSLDAFRLTDVCDGKVIAADLPGTIWGPTDPAACGAVPPSGPALAPDEGVPETLDASQIREAMAPAAPMVNRCFEAFGVPGRVDAFLDIASDGHVTLVEVRGELADTPTAKCIVAALKKVQFPRFRRASMQVNYPYILR